MVLRVHNLESWRALLPGQAIPFMGAKRRVIRVDFNAEADAAIHLTDPDGNLAFLGLVKGLQTIEFVAGDPEFGRRYADADDAKLLVTATCEGGVWYRTVDGDVEGYSSVSDSFVKVATRRSRNPELELMMFKQEQNMRRREEKLAGDVAALMARFDQQRADASLNAEDGSVGDEAAGSDEVVAGSGAVEAAGGSDGGGAPGKAGAKVASKGAAGSV